MLLLDEPGLTLHGKAQADLLRFFKEKLAALGGKPIAGTPEDFGKVIAAETEKWAPIVKASGAKVE